VVRSSNPALFALASGIQWFTLGSTFTASRGFIRQARGDEKISPSDSISISAISGLVAGSAGGILRKSPIIAVDLCVSNGVLQVVRGTFYLRP
jgi:hypothetical protein